MNIRSIALARLSAAAIAAALTTQALAFDTLVLSDLHFDPFYEPPGTTVGEYGFDPPWALVDGALRAAKKTVPFPNLILLSGDYLAHNWRNKYFKAHPSASEADYQNFTKSTVGKLMDEIALSFDGVPIAAALGNEDSFCGDYALPDSGDILGYFSQKMAGLARLPAAEQKQYQQELNEAGHGSFTITPAHNERLVIVNSVYFSRAYTPRCSTGTVDPAKRELAWLKKTLETAQANGQGVWMLMHVPPGIDANASHGKGHGVPFWKQEYHDEFMNLLRQYGSHVRFIFAGHTHMDENRVIKAGNVRIPVKTLPGVSPVFQNNPAYSLFKLTQRSGGDWQVYDYQVFGLPRLPTPTSTVTNAWPTEYDFYKTYGSSADAAAFSSIAAQAGGTDLVASSYWKYFDASSGRATPRPSAGTDISIWWRCAMENADVNAYDSCVLR